MNKKDSDRIQNVLTEYKIKITDYAIKEFGYSYANQEELKSNWLKIFKATSENLEKLIIWTKTFIRVNSDINNNKELSSFVKLCADYLSRYSVRINNIDKTSEVKKLTVLISENINKEKPSIQSSTEKYANTRKTLKYVQVNYQKKQKFN